MHSLTWCFWSISEPKTLKGQGRQTCPPPLFLSDQYNPIPTRTVDYRLLAPPPGLSDLFLRPWILAKNDDVMRLWQYMHQFLIHSTWQPKWGGWKVDLRSFQILQSNSTKHKSIKYWIGMADALCQIDDFCSKNPWWFKASIWVPWSPLYSRKYNPLLKKF